MSEVMRLRQDSQPPSDSAGDPDRLSGWRTRRLRAAGFPAALATRLGGDNRIDVHELLDLVDRGCPPELAASIAAPLDPDPRASLRRSEPS